MNDSQYRDTQDRLQLIGSLALTLDLDGFLDRISRTETLAPILDPTLYMRGSDKLQQVRELAEAVHRVQRVARAHVGASS